MKHSKVNSPSAYTYLEPSLVDAELPVRKLSRARGSRLTAPSRGQPSGVHQGDARDLAKILAPESVDVTITSPPYFDLKDYGAPNQIGFGQDYPTYLSDLGEVFEDVFRATKKDGSLWIIIDTFRRDQEVFALPFDLVAKLKEAGWILRDVIIWKKDRTLPWTHKGTTKRIFEYILVLAKTRQHFRYYPDRHRDNSELKEWWVRYPERYNPQGKALEEVWNFNIPKQGSWGSKHIRHFCPLPSEMVSRIIRLTTVPGDLVLDPFSGTGTVLTQADLLGRRYIGFELNNRYIKMFQRHLEHQRANQSRTTQVVGGKRAKEFERLIVDLRVLKYGRLLHRASLKLLGRKHHVRVFVRKLTTKVTQKHKLVTAEYILYVEVAGLCRRLAKHLNDIAKIPPLSKFGIEATLKVVNDARALSPYKRGPLYVYSSTNSHKFSGKIKFKQVQATEFPIVTPIKIKVESPDGY